MTISHVISFKCQYINIPHTLHFVEGGLVLPLLTSLPSPPPLPPCPIPQRCVTWDVLAATSIGQTCFKFHEESFLAYQALGPP
jgi:hypothetical protein